MKKGVSLLFFFCLIQSAFAANYGEAEVIGKVASILKTEEGCLVKASGFSFYLESGVHPLYESEVMAQGISLSKEQCLNLNVQDEFSGILVQNDEKITLEN